MRCISRSKNRMRHRLQVLGQLLSAHFRWEAWEQAVSGIDIVLDRPHRSTHPRFRDIVYPMDYGYLSGTLSTDGEGLDVFMGSGDTGLVGLIITHDHRKGDREIKLLYNCSPREIYLAHGFLNFDQTRMEGVLVMRQPMVQLWHRDVR